MGDVRRPAQGMPRLRLHGAGDRQIVLPIARSARPRPQGTPSVEQVEARAAQMLAGVGQRQRQAGLEEARPALSASDPRWVLALRAGEVMAGDMLRPAQRQRLNQLGQTMGLTPFQCSLVIAIVQDQRRRGQSLQDATPTLLMVPVGDGRPAQPVRWRLAGLITAAVLGIEAAMAAWLLL